jgi:hypothetical protein
VWSKPNASTAAAVVMSFFIVVFLDRGCSSLRCAGRRLNKELSVQISRS